MISVLILSPQRWRSGVFKDLPLFVLPQREEHQALSVIDYGGKKRREYSSHWRMIKGTLNVGVGRVEGWQHREREGYSKGLHSSVQELYCADVFANITWWPRLPWERSPTASLPFWVLSVDVRGGGEDDLFLVGAELRKTCRYIHWDFKAFLCLMVKYSWHNKTAYSLKSD